MLAPLKSAGLAAVLAAVALALAPVAAQAEASRSADSFVESIGVDTHTSFSDTPYASNFSLVEQRLTELGVRHVREDLVPDRPDQYERLNQLAALGIHSTLILGDPNNGTGVLDELLGTAATTVRGSVEALEGPNEFDRRGGGDWMQRVAAYQAQLYAGAKGNPALATLPVIGPTIGSWASRTALTDISSSLDAGAIHPYPNGEAPESNIEAQLQMIQAMSGSKPVYATETGYHTAVNTSEDQHRPTSEAAMATYMPRLYLEYFRRGVVRTFAYELLDEFPDPNHERIESNFGLLRNDLSPKPAFTALQNLISILRDSGPEFGTGELDYRVADGGRALHRVLLQKRDGTFYLALWRADSVWDSRSRSAEQAATEPVRLDFGGRVGSALEYVPNGSAAPQDRLQSKDGVLSVPVGPEVVLLAFKAGPPRPAGRIKLWLANRKPASKRVALAARLPHAYSGKRTRLFVQRWRKGWHTVGRGHASRRGTFHKTIKLRGKQRASRLRVIAANVKPSNAIRVRVR